MPAKKGLDLRESVFSAADELEQRGLPVVAINVGRKLSTSKISTIEKILVEWRANKQRASMKTIDLRHTSTIPQLLKEANELCIRSNLSIQKRDQVLMSMKRKSHDFRSFVSAFENHFLGKVLVVGKPWEQI